MPADRPLPLRRGTLVVSCQARADNPLHGPVHMAAMARVCNCSIFVKNDASYAGLGLGGEGYTSFTIASPTGEGLTTAVHFTRERRCTLKEAFRFV